MNQKEGCQFREVGPGSQQVLVLCSPVLFPGSFLPPFLTSSSVFFSLQPQIPNENMLFEDPNPWLGSVTPACLEPGLRKAWSPGGQHPSRPGTKMEPDYPAIPLSPLLWDEHG